jgi:radical SAM superfamily enzyme with C-terminal helix-hairpin-helix motif
MKNFKRYLCTGPVLVHDHLYLLRIRPDGYVLRCICINMKLKGKSWSRRLMCGQFTVCMLVFTTRERQMVITLRVIKLSVILR